MIIRPANSLRGAIYVPGDKSISHRAVMVAAFANGTSKIENLPTGEDCSSTVNCFRELGVRIEREENTLIVHGVGKQGFVAPAKPLDCGNSGTTMRLLAGILAGQNFSSVLTGDESLRNRPMGRIIEPLTKMGAIIASDNGCAPLSILGRNPLNPIEYEMPIASAQVKSCVLLAGLSAQGETILKENSATRDHTEIMLRMFGAEIDVNFDAASGQNRIVVRGDSILRGHDIDIPGDISSAAFFVAAAACLPGSDILIRSVGVNKTRIQFLDILTSFGANIELENRSDNEYEPAADIRVRGGLRPAISGRSNLICENIVPEIIDEIPILAVFGTQLADGLEIRGASELRKKESDRIASVCENLTRMGAAVTEFDDGFRVERSQLKGAAVDSFGDHRIAMAFAVAGLLAGGETTILGSESADVSFPGFFELLNTVTQRVGLLSYE